MLLKKSYSLIVFSLLSINLSACSVNQLNTVNLDNTRDQIISKDIKSFRIKDGFSGATPEKLEAYRLTYTDVNSAIRNKTIPYSMYHYLHAFVFEQQRLESNAYKSVLGRIINKEWSEEAYLIAYPDVKAAVDSGMIPSGYFHWYNHSVFAEPGRLTSPTYLNAKAATDAGFSEKAYRLAWTDIDNQIKSGVLPSAYAHWNSYAKNNETIRLSDPRYIKIKRALDLGFNENAYLLAYPDVKNSNLNALFHYINYGLNEFRLELQIYQDAKIGLLLGFDEQKYRNAFPDVNNAINNGVYPSAFMHYHMYGKNEGRLNRPEYLNSIPNINGTVGN